MFGATNTSLNNLITIEFDFIPNSDEISFEYVFASKEYHWFYFVQNLMMFLDSLYLVQVFQAHFQMEL